MRPSIFLLPRKAAERYRGARLTQDGHGERIFFFRKPWLLLQLCGCFHCLTAVTGILERDENGDTETNVSV